MKIQNEILKILADNLINHLKVIMEESGKKLSDNEAENLMFNISAYVLNEKLKQALKSKT